MCESSRAVSSQSSEHTIESNWVHAELEPKLLQQIEGGYVTIFPIALDAAKVEADLKLY